MVDRLAYRSLGSVVCLSTLFFWQITDSHIDVALIGLAFPL